MLSPEFIDKIIEINKAEEIEIDGDLYTSKKLYRLDKSDASPVLLKVHTLTGLLDYYKYHLDDSKHYVIHVQSYCQVDLYGELENRIGRRKHFLQSSIPEFDFIFNSYYNFEMFLIKLQTQFELNDKLKNLLSLISNIKDESSLTLADDLTTQKATFKTGIARVEEKPLPNPVLLKPKRTFAEISQPECPFVLRMKKGQVGIDFALFEADGGQWQIECIEKIRDYFIEKISSDNLYIIA